MVKFENREIWADLENRSKVVHSENFPIWRPASGHLDHVTHHVTSHMTHWGQWKYASRSWHAVGNHRRQLKLMYRSKISGRGPKHCCGSKFQCRPRPGYLLKKYFWWLLRRVKNLRSTACKHYRKCDVIYRYLHIELIWCLLMVQYLQNNVITFYSFYRLDSLENTARPQLHPLSLTVKKLRCQASYFTLRFPKPPI